MDKECWKDIKGYEGFYQVSNLGRIISLKRKATNNKNGGVRIVPEKVLSATDNGNGYKFITLHKNQKRKNFYVHRLVAEHFLEKPCGKEYVNHLDYDTSNNKVTNLQWCTQLENIAYSIERMKKPKRKCRISSTGEKYITKQIIRGANYYRVNIKNKGIEKRFRNLFDAICYRNEVVQNG